MQAALERWLGVDARQLRALLGTALRLDLRAGSSVQGSLRRSAGLGRAARLLLAYSIVGSGVAWLIASSDDVFTAGLVHLGTLGFMLGAMVVLEFNSLIVSPDDYRTLAHLPVGSETFFFARLAHVLAYTGALGCAFSVAPLWVLTFSIQGFQPWIGLTAALASLAVSAAVTLCALAVYAALLRFVHPSRLRGLLSWVQLSLSLSVYAGFLLLRKRGGLAQLPDLSPDAAPAILLFPGSWFACWLEIAAGRIGAAQLLGVALSLGLIATMLSFAARVLSLSYAERLAALDLEAEPRTQRRRREAWLFRRGESRALGLLVPSQFRNDIRFRLGVLGILPLTLLYMFLAVESGPLPDPFASAEVTQGMVLLYLAALISPALLVPSFVYSDAFAAAWILHATPADRRRLVLAMRNCIAVGFIVPCALLIALTFAWHFAALWHALVHGIALGGCAALFLLLAMLVNPGLPFAAPVQRGRFTLRTLVPFSLAPLCAFVVLPWLFQQAYASLAAGLLIAAAVALLNLLGGRWVAERVARSQASAQYLG
jgi:hypothetical protein